MRQGITRIERCIAKVEAFDPQMIRTLHDTSKAEALSALVDSVLVQTFGEDTAEYRRYLGANPGSSMASRYPTRVQSRGQLCETLPGAE
jgi:hypothetical protein